MASEVQNPIPLIMAGSGNLELWPHSRVNFPIQFVRDSDGKTPFQKTLLEAAAICREEDLRVCVSANCLELAREQTAQVNLGKKVRYFVEPVDRGTLAPLVSMLLLLQGGHERIVTVFHSHQSPRDITGFSSLIDDYRRNASLREYLIFAAEPAGSIPARPLDILGLSAEPDSNSLFRLTDSPRQAPRAATFSGAFCASIGLLMQFTDKKDGSVIDSCRTALRGAERRENIILPDLNLWSLMPRAEISALRSPNLNRIRVRLFSAKNRKPDAVYASAPSRDIFTQDCDNCTIEGAGPLVALCGCENLHVLVSPDAVLIRDRARSPNPLALTDQLRKQSRHQLYDPAHRSHEWGVSTELERRDDLEIHLLHIRPQCAMQPHWHAHRRETWQILSGSGHALLDGQKKEAREGDFFAIEPKMIHALINRGDQVLQVIQCRKGPLSKNDWHSADSAPPPPPSRPSQAPESLSQEVS